MAWAAEPINWADATLRPGGKSGPHVTNSLTDFVDGHLEALKGASAGPTGKTMHAGPARPAQCLPIPPSRLWGWRALQ